MPTILPPGLAGWVAADENRRQNEAASLQQLGGLLGAQTSMLNQQNLRAEMMEKERVRGLMGQFPAVIAGGNDKEIIGLLAQMDPKSAMQYIMQRAENPVSGHVNINTPEGERVGLIRKNATITPTQFAPAKSAGSGSQMERAWSGLNDLQERVNDGYVPTARDMLNANAWRAEIEAPKFSVDPASGRAVWAQTKALGPEYTIFGGRPGAAPPGQPAPGGGSPSGVLKPGQELPPPGEGRRSALVGEKGEMEMLAKGYQQVKQQLDTFKDSYAGFITDKAGRVVEEADARMNQNAPHGGDMAKWWRGERQRKADVRRLIAGMTLTGFEKSDFESYNPHSGLSPDVLKQDLLRQKEIIEREMVSRLSAAAASGQNVEEFKRLMHLKDTGLVGTGGEANVPAGQLAAPAETPAAPQAYPKPNQKAIGILRMEREAARAEFEEKFGPGSADQYIGPKR